MGRGGRRDPSEYIKITAKVFYSPRHGKNKVRLCLDEKFPQSMNIECARVIRQYSIGTKIRLRVVDTEREDGELFLYSSYKWKHKLVK
jgi:hypothetical protein